MSDKPIVHVIQPTTQKENGLCDTQIRKRRVAAYARVSTDDEEQLTSYENQIRYYTQYISSNPEWEFAGIYTDEGISGVNTKARTGFRQMVEDALDGKIDLILTKSISRFARNTVDSLTTIRQLKDKGVEIYFEKENIHTFDSKGELMITIMSSIAQEESRSISENVKWGRRKRMAQGKVSLPYGAFLGYEKGEDGKPQIVEEEAEIIRRIYQLYLDGCTVREIARILTNDKIPTPSGKNCNWSVSTIMSILRNEKYKGDALLQKVYTVDFLSKKTRKNDGVLPQYYVEKSHPAIIDEETFDLVQEELAKRDHRRGRRSGSVFDNKVICGSCGYFYGQKLWYSHNGERDYVWRCTHKYDSEPNCQTPIVRDDDLKTAFISALNQILKEKDAYINELGTVLENVRPAQAGQIKRYLDALGQQPNLVKEFSETAFAMLTESITIQDDGGMAIRFKDGREITIHRTEERRGK